MPQSAVCKLETQKSQYCNSSHSPKAWEQVGAMVYIPVQGEKKTGVPPQAGRQERKRTNSSFLCLLFYLIPQQTGYCPPIPPTHTHWGGQFS